MDSILDVTIFNQTIIRRLVTFPVNFMMYIFPAI